MNGFAKALLIAAALAGGGYLALLALLWWGQERLLFQPVPLPAAHRFDFGADVQERWFEVPGARLSALHLQLPAPKGLVFYLHGNAGNLQSWFVDPDFWRRANFDLLMIDYRGYGKSSGRIGSQAELQADARAALAAVLPRYAGKRLVILGRSLGSGLAADLAAEVQPDLTVLVSPYLSLQALAGEIYPWVPGALLRYPLRSDQWLPRIRGPVLLIHGQRDELIPPSHTERLAALAPQARVLKLPGAGHNDLQQFQAYLDGLRGALDRL
ncbi:MAG: alpha/beta fold hydrolase [Rubrivivax sp.]